MSNSNCFAPAAMTTRALPATVGGRYVGVGSGSAQRRSGSIANTGEQMPKASAPDDLDDFLDTILASTPLFFIQDFLRKQKQRHMSVRIGPTRKEVRANLRDAIIARSIGRTDVEQWFRTVEGWGKQHLYILKARQHPLRQPHLLNNLALTNFLRSKGFLTRGGKDADPPSSHILSDVEVDDELARITWRSHAVHFERHEELDEQRERDDGEYEFRAYRRTPKRSASRLLIRKIDGVVLFLVDMPLGEDHGSISDEMARTSKAILTPHAPSSIQLSQIVKALDEGAVANFGPRSRRSVEIHVDPTQARYRTDGARLEFKSTREAAGYTDSAPVRHVRNAMQVARFEGEAGKFRLSFQGSDRKAHDMIVSLHAFENRIFLFSRMEETEVLALVDQLIVLE